MIVERIRYNTLLYTNRWYIIDSVVLNGNRQMQNLVNTASCEDNHVIHSGPCIKIIDIVYNMSRSMTAVSSLLKCLNLESFLNIFFPTDNIKELAVEIPDACTR